MSIRAVRGNRIIIGECEPIKQLWLWSLIALATNGLCEIESTIKFLLDEVRIENASFARACEIIQGIVRRQHPELKLEFDFTPPDPRVACMTNSLRQPVSLNMRDVPLEDALRVMCESGVLTAMDNVMTFKDSRRAWMFVAPRSKAEPIGAAFGNFDRRLKMDGKPLTIEKLLEHIAQFTEMEIELDPMLHQITWETTVTIPESEYPCFWLLKACVETLTKAAEKEVALYKPSKIQDRFSIDQTGGMLGISFKTTELEDVRSLLPLFTPAKDGEPDSAVTLWNGTQDDFTFKQMLENINQLMDLSAVYFEPHLNCFWMVGNNRWLVTLNGMRVVRSDRQKSYELRITKESEVTVSEKPRP